MSARINAKTLLIAVAVVVLLAIAGAGGIAYATGSSDDESSQQTTGPGMDKAKSVALDYMNGGNVTGTEIHDEEGYYEIEVTKNGSQTDVHLDQNFNVLNAPADHEDQDGKDGPNDD